MNVGEFYRGLLSRPACETCILRGSPIVPPEGKIGARIAFIGEGPGREEVRIGAPFRGESGRLLDEILKRAEVDRRDVWITNAVLCPIRSVTEYDETNKTTRLVSADVVTNRAAASCRSRLVEELRLINPRVVVPLGRPALSTIRGVPTSIMKHRGGVDEVDL